MNNTIAHNKADLLELIKSEMNMHGDNCDLNFIDVSRITDMSDLFKYSNFNGRIDKWDTSNVISMRQMFYGSKFNGDISKWDVRNVRDMTDMFADSLFNTDISNWNVEKVYYMQFMFYNSKFAGNLDDWRPYEADDFFKTFSKNTKCLPYWAQYENSAQRNKAIRSYIFNKQLSKDLTEKSLKPKVKL